MFNRKKKCWVENVNFLSVYRPRCKQLITAAVTTRVKEPLEDESAVIHVNSYMLTCRDIINSHLRKRARFIINFSIKFFVHIEGVPLPPWAGEILERSKDLAHAEAPAAGVRERRSTGLFTCLLVSLFVRVLVLEPTLFSLCVLLIMFVHSFVH